MIKTFKDNRKRVGSQHKKEKKVEQPLSVPLAPLRLEPLTQNRAEYETMIAFYYSTMMLFILSLLRLLITYYTKAPFIPLVGFDRKMNESNYNWVYTHSCIPVEVPTNDLEKVRTPSLIGLGRQ